MSGATTRFICWATRREMWHVNLARAWPFVRKLRMKYILNENAGVSYSIFAVSRHPIKSLLKFEYKQGNANVLG